MYIEELESNISRLESGECEAFDREEGRRPATAADICEQLEAIRRELRRIAWSPSFKAWARDLSARAGREINRLCAAHDLIHS